MTAKGLSNKRIVIIGGTTGMGLSAAKAFVEEGANVIAVGRNPESVAKAKMILGDHAEVMVADAMNPRTASDAIGLCIERYQGI